MFKFKKKEIISEEDKKYLKILCIFYDINKDKLSQYSNQKEKRKIIKEIYKTLNFNIPPKLKSNYNSLDENYKKIYRGISADSYDELEKYINEFLNGEAFYGGRASIYGTGIYTVIGDNSDVASKYASDGNTNNCGIVVESAIEDNTNIINYSKIDLIRVNIINRLKKIYGEEINNYIELLEDDGVLSAILGYDAIYVEEKEYLFVLNRNKMIVDDFKLKEQLNEFNTTVKR